MNRLLVIYLCAAVGIIVSAPLPAGGDMILSDTFNNALPAADYAGDPAGTGDYGLNQELQNRQWGMQRPISYNRRPAASEDDASNTQVNPADMSGKLAFRVNNGFNPYAVLSENLATNLELAVDLDPVVGDTSGGNWVSISLRGQSADHIGSSVPLSPTSGVSLLMKPDGSWAIVMNGDFVGEGGQIDESRIIRGQTAPADNYTVVLRVQEDRLSGTINGRSIDDSGLGIALRGAAAGADNFVALSGYAVAGSALPDVWHTVENIGIGEIGTYIPEPTALSLLAAGAAMGAGRRRRRTKR